MALLTDQEVDGRLADLSGWQRQDRAIAKTYGCDNFVGSVEFLKRVTELAEAANHHPDVEISWDKVTLSLSTHAQGGLTSADFELAQRIDELP